MKQGFALLAACALLLAGCSGSGGGESDFKGDVSGIIFDVDGVPVRDAHVYFDGGGGKSIEAQSNSNGVYQLPQVPQGDQIIRAEVTQNGTRFFGSNVASIDRNAATLNLNIAVYRDDKLGSIEGYVFDRQGYKLQGARVFVKQQTTNTVLTSSYAITDGEGHYNVGALRAGQPYDVQVNGLDYNSDFDAFTLSTNERRRLDFTLPTAENITLAAPKNVFVTAWTSPPVTRDAQLSAVIENMKQIIKPGYKKKASTRETSNGAIVELDVLWDPIVDNALLGFGLYRSNDGGSYRDIYFLQDPLAELFADMDLSLRPGTNYGYKVTSISTGSRESNFSNSASATPLGELTLRNSSGSSRPTFNWNSASGAADYTVYLFDRYPGVSVSQIWDNSTSPVTGNTLTYNGSSLTSGTYYYLVVGTSAQGNYSLSPVGQIIVP